MTNGIRHIRVMLVGFVLAYAGSLSAICEESATRTIFLKEVWALDMPGTRPMNAARNVEADDFLAPEGPLLSEIIEALNYPERLSPEVRELLNGSSYGGFVVAGRKMDALQNVHAIVVDGKTPQKKFDADETLSAFFFTLPSPQFVHLTEIVQKGTKVRMNYRLVPHKSKQTTVHVALVPIEHPGARQLQIAIERSSKNNVHN